MNLSRAACGTAAVVLGLLAIGPAAAQPYPPYGPPPSYSPYGPPPVYAAPREVPPYPGPRVLADDELPPDEIPGGPSSSVAGPYPVSPAQPSPYTGSVPAAGPEYPPPYGAAPSAAYPAGPAPAPTAAYPPSGPAPAPTTAYPPGPAPGASGPPAAANAPAGTPDGVLRPPVEIDPAQRQTIAALPPEEQPEAQPKELPAHLRRQLVDFTTKEPAGTIVIDTPHTYLYLVLGRGKAMRYGIGVGREGFTWAGIERVSKMTEWPDWYPPNEMIDRQPYLPRMMAGGPGNPLGARALYLGKSLYRIHGTNQPSTIGQFVSSGCIRLLNEDIEDLYGRVTVGTRVVVLPGSAPGPSASAQPVVSAPQGPPSVR
jgi:lipoprotein-anchoring transpeptidase ErfK/SrfK